MRITVKKVVLFLVACVIAGRLATTWMENDPHHAEVINFVKSDRQVIDQVGPITATRMAEITSVQSGIGVDDKFTPGYDLYRVSVQGERASAQVSVERKTQQSGTNSELRIISID